MESEIRNVIKNVFVLDITRRTLRPWTSLTSSLIFIYYLPTVST
jgi:hypothetical protein